VNRPLADLTWQAVDAQAPAAFLAVPIGATEQHGPHLPLSTDTDIAVALATELSRARPHVLVAPAVPYGSSGEHAGFPGTLSLGQEATELLLLELVRSASAVFARTLLISTHGGNAPSVRRAQRRLLEEGRDVQVFTPAWHGDAHAGRTETSVMLALAPDRVRLRDATAGTVAPLRELMPVLRAHGVRAASANGVLGDPSGATAQEGRALLARAVGRLVQVVDEWASGPAVFA
jgi:creatinine amidohydrolase